MVNGDSELKKVTNWRDLVRNVYITSEEKKLGVTVKFLEDAPTETVNTKFAEPSTYYEWRVVDQKGNERIFSGSFNFLKHLRHFTVQELIHDLSNVTLKIKQVGEGFRTSYKIERVES